MPLISEKIETPYKWEQVGSTRHFIMCPWCKRTALPASTRAEAIQNARDKGWLVEEDAAGHCKVECVHCNVERR